MKVNPVRIVATVVLLVLLACRPVLADVSPEERDLVNEVYQRLIAVAPKPVNVPSWPPVLVIAASDEINAFASIEEPKNGMRVTTVTVTTGILHKVVEQQPDRLAYILGHEISHHLLGHTVPVLKKEDRTAIVQAHRSRQQEFDADVRGAELALKAGYSFSEGRKFYKTMLDANIVYGPTPGLQTDHPSWSERLALLDPGNARFYRAMSAFNDGAYFLTMEQYVPAEVCFRAVTSEFPDAPEAYANLGYDYLMQYCDKLEAKDLERFDLGNLIAGSFFARPGTETLVKGVDAELWDKAINTLQVALSKEPNDPLIKHNLGLAYLLNPTGPIMELANRYMQEAAAAAERDDSMDPMARAAILINTGVMQIRGGRAAQGNQRFQAAERVVRSYLGEPGTVDPTFSLSSALLFNRALVAQRDSQKTVRKQAIARWEQYLRATSGKSVWYDVAYDHYRKLCTEFHVSPKPKASLPATVVVYRPIFSVDLGGGHTLRVGQEVNDLAALKVAAVPSVDRKSLTRLHFPQLGLDLLANDRVLAIVLQSKDRMIPVRAAGPGGKLLGTLHVGMTASDLAKVTGNDYSSINLDDPAVTYLYYRGLGVAARLENGAVKELVIVQAPS